MFGHLQLGLFPFGINYNLNSTDFTPGRGLKRGETHV
jgi:hypothetical protein